MPLAKKSDDVVVLYTNDVHCGVDAGTPEDTMGYANLAAYKHAMEEAHEHVVLVDAGDAIQGEAIGTLSNGSVPGGHHEPGGLRLRHLWQP